MTAVELLKKDLDAEIKLGTKMVVNWDMYLEMEKQQIIDAWFDGYGGSAHSEDEYYNETYGSKGSDETLKDYHIVDTNEMVFSQTEISNEAQRIYGEHQIQMLEISDEEIEKSAKEWYNKKGIANYKAEIRAWVSACKWYREQLKQR